MKIVLTRLLVAVLLASAALVGAEIENTAHKAAGTKAFDFLHLGFDARTLSMGEARFGVKNAICGVLGNPSSVAFIDNIQGMISYRPIILDVKSGAIAAAKPYEKSGNWALNLAYLSLGKIDGVDEQNMPTGQTWSHNSLVGSVTWSMLVAKQMAVGASLKGIYDNISSNKESSYTADGIAIDLGWQYRMKAGRLVYGAVIKNVGFVRDPYTKLTSIPALPWSIGAGISYVPRYFSALMIAFDLEKPSDGYLDYRLGLEYDIYKRHLFMRGGYQFSQRELGELIDVLKGDANDYYQRTNWSTFSLGAGFATPAGNTEFKVDAAINFRVDGLPPSLAVTALVGI
jgi:hypothetical protein